MASGATGPPARRAEQDLRTSTVARCGSKVGQLPFGRAAEKPVARRVGPAAAGPGAASSRARLPLAPSAAEIERERAEQKTERDAPAAGTPPASTGDRLQQRATATPTQDRRWPTSSPSTQGAGGSLGPRTMADRKGALQDASGPQQGVIRNRW